MNFAAVARNSHRLLVCATGRSGAGGVVRRSPPIATLSMIGDRATAAVVTTRAEICWYCPGRFDAPSLLDSLLDPNVGGAWRIELPEAEPASRCYLERSAVLQTTLHHPAGALTVTDWMVLGGVGARGRLCRRLGPAPAALRLVLRPRPEGGRRIPALRLDASGAGWIDDRFRLQASHPIRIRDDALEIDVRSGERAWATLDDGQGSGTADLATVEGWLNNTMAGWRTLAARSPYDGPFADAVHDSLRAVRLLTYEPTGAIVAAITTSLPEVEGGNRNYDYRFSWLRDSGMMIRALVRFEPDHRQALHYLDFVAGLLNTGYQSPLDPVAAVGGERVPAQVKLPVAGYGGSLPALTGNKAAHQLQLGSLAQFVLAAREIYAVCDARPHWKVVSAVADFLADNWQQKGSGIWEEAALRHYTSSLVSASVALDGIALFADNPVRAARYRRAALGLRQFVSRTCLSRDGIYVVRPGSRSVDISAALFPVWGYVPADDTMMANSIALLERQAAVGGGLLHRHLQKSRAAACEGAFLVGTFWLAHYRIALGELDAAQVLLEQGLSYANDVGFFSEEVDAKSGLLLGNLPLGLAHASFLGAVADYDAARRGANDA